MKSILFLAVVLNFCWFGAVIADTIDVQSKISEVVVFPDQATIIRKASFNLPQGTHTLQLMSLPGNIITNSITAKGSGQHPVKLYGAELVTRQLPLTQNKRVREIEEKLKELRIEEKALLNNKNALIYQQEFLKSIKAASSDQIGKDIITRQLDVEEIQKMLEFLDRGFTENFSRLHENENKIKQILLEIDRLERELNQLDASHSKSERLIEIEVESEKTGPFNLEVSYRIYGAGWKPAYEVRAESGGKTVYFTGYGILTQNTGEDWDNVQLTLSTARPSIGGRMPELEPWYLRERKVGILSVPGAEGRQRSLLKRETEVTGIPSEVAEVADEYAEQKGAYETKYAEEVYAHLGSHGSAVTYNLPKPKTILSDNQPHKLPVSQVSLSADMAYETTPKLVEIAFLRARVTNETDNFYLPGPVQIFLDGDFVATSSIDGVAPQETFDIFLGADQRIKVKRKMLKDKVDAGKIKKFDRTYLISIENFTEGEVNIILIDQIPVSENEDIKVQSVVLTPKQYEEDPGKPGVRQWNFVLGPGQKKEIEISFRISHPSEMIVEQIR